MASALRMLQHVPLFVEIVKDTMANLEPITSEGTFPILNICLSVIMASCTGHRGQTIPITHLIKQMLVSKLTRMFLP